MASLAKFRKSPANWIPVPGHAYRSKRALAPIIAEKRRRNIPIHMKQERNIYGTDVLRREIKETRVSNKRTNRRKVYIRPCVAYQYIESKVLQFRMRVKMSMGAMRQIEDAGSFDDYILKTAEIKLGSAFAINMKRKMAKKERTERFYDEWRRDNKRND